MDEQLARRIEAENAREIASVQNRMAGRDWSIVLGATALIMAIFGFIYFADNTAIDNETTIEPAAGTTTYEAPAPDYGVRENPGASPTRNAPVEQLERDQTTDRPMP